MRQIKTIKTNFIYNSIKIIGNLLFPIITFPYLSRVLNPVGIGKVAFVNSIVSYFIMFASLGIPLYGIREVAKVREDKEKLRITLSEIFCINLFTTIFILIIYILCVHNNFLGEEKFLLYTIGLTIFFKFIGVEWFYQGIEEYKYMAVREIYFKIISLILLFIFVKTKDDYIIYGMITAFSMIGIYIVNFIYLKNFSSFTFKNLNLKKHFRPIAIIFSMNIAASIYLNLDHIMLGYKSTQEAVGLYSSGIKLVKLVLGIVGSLGVVLFPRISNYIENGLEKELEVLLNKGLKILLLIALPCFIGLYFTANEIVLIFSGEKFKDSIITMKYLTPIIIFISLSNFIGTQILYPRNQEKKILISVIIGSIINLVLNWFLIPKYQQNGAALSTVIAEGIVAIIQIILGYKYLKILKINREYIKPFIAVILMIFTLILVDKFNLERIYLKLIIKILLGSVIYIFLLVLLKEKLIIEFTNKILKKNNINRCSMKEN